MCTFIVKGQTFNVSVDPEMPLLWVLRDVLGVTEPKFGCYIGRCRGCTVLVDGKARPSCFGGLLAHYTECKISKV